VLDISITPEKLILIAIFLLVGFPVHEAAHAFAADRLGDATARLLGRLTLNPVRHFDPIGGSLFVLSVIVGGFVIGWAKPTPVNPSNLRDRRNSEVVVALAGPAVNLILACLAAIAFRALVGLELSLPLLVGQTLFSFVLYNLFLMIFNLIPVPPLDGSAVLFRFLSPATAWRVRPMLNQYGLVAILLVVLFLGTMLSNWVMNVAFFLVGL
jgi:Zn-dependent protease